MPMDRPASRRSPCQNGGVLADMLVGRRLAAAGYTRVATEAAPFNIVLEARP